MDQIRNYVSTLISLQSETVGEKRMFLNSILGREPNWVVHVPRGNCLFHGAIEGLKTKVKGVGRRTRLLDYLRNRRYWELKEEAED